MLPNVLAKNYAYKKSCYESLLVDESGDISEGSSTNAWMVSKNNVVITRKAIMYIRGREPSGTREIARPGMRLYLVANGRNGRSLK